VSDSTLAVDRSLKQAIYARHSIEEYWIVNLPEEQVEVYSDPSGLVASPQYHSLQTFRRGESIPLNLGGVEVASVRVTDILP
jgi:Uma2 family endonuclease